MTFVEACFESIAPARRLPEWYAPGGLVAYWPEVLVTFIGGRQRLDLDAKRLRTELTPKLLFPKVAQKLDTAHIHALLQLSKLKTTGVNQRARIGAVAALFIWRFGSDEHSAQALAQIQEHGLVRDPTWLYDVVRILGRTAHERHFPPQRQLRALVEALAEAKHTDLASWIVGLYFTKRYDSWWLGESKDNVVRACDKAALDFQPIFFEWFETAARVAVTGGVTHPWLEPLVGAALRVMPPGPERERVAQFHAQARYTVTKERLAKMHDAALYQVRLGDARVASELIDRVFLLKSTNPHRAMLLLELVLEAIYSRSIESILVSGVEDPLVEHLAALYVLNLETKPYALRAAQAYHDSEILRRAGVGPDIIEVYETVANYGHSLRGRRVNIQGIWVDHADKDAAAFVHYFRTKRTNSATVTQWIHDTELPEWGAVKLSQTKAVDLGFNVMMRSLSELSLSVKRPVLRDYEKHAFLELSSMDEIAGLEARVVNRVAWYARHRAIAAATLIGGVAGGLAPFTDGLSAVFDAPYIMYLTTEICTAACEYYGFDPRMEPELPTIILGVALMGANPQSLQSEFVSDRFHRYMLRKSLFLAATSFGRVRHIVGPALIPFLSLLVGKRNSGVLGLVKKAARPPVHVDTTETRWILASVEALGGALLNLALVYDLTEAAQAVLLDRFLARKYPDWRPSW